MCVLMCVMHALAHSVWSACVRPRCRCPCKSCLRNLAVKVVGVKVKDAPTVTCRCTSGLVQVHTRLCALIHKPFGIRTGMSKCSCQFAVWNSQDLFWSISASPGIPYASQTSHLWISMWPCWVADFSPHVSKPKHCLRVCRALATEFI